MLCPSHIIVNANGVVVDQWETLIWDGCQNFQLSWQPHMDECRSVVEAAAVWFRSIGSLLFDDR